MIVSILYGLAITAFLLGALDIPQFGTLRCISLGLALLVLAQTILQ